MPESEQPENKLDRLAPEDLAALEKRRWFHRRSIAYLSMGGLFGVLFACAMWPLDRLTATEGILIVLAYMFTGIAAAYMGLATFQHLGKKS